MQQVQLLPGDRLAHGGDGADGDGVNDQIQRSDLQQDGEQLFRGHAGARDRVREQKLRRFVPLLAAQAADGRERGVERAAEAEHVAALDGVIAGERAEVQPVHPEGGGEAAHRREHLADLAHLALHLRIEIGADREQKGDRARPDPEGQAALPKLMLYDRHVRSPAFS